MEKTGKFLGGNQPPVAKKTVKNKKLFKSEDKINISKICLKSVTNNIIQTKKKQFSNQKDSLISHSRVMKDSLENSLNNENTNSFNKREIFMEVNV